MSKRSLAVFAAAFLLALAAYATDDWKDKDFTDWDQKDVTKILTDSPWVKKIDLGSGGGGGGAAAAAPVSDVGHSTLSGTDNSDVGRHGGGMPAGGGGADASGAPSDASRGGGGGTLSGSYTIQWASSLTYREAYARNRELSGVSARETRKDLDKEQEGYIISLRGDYLAPFSRTSQDILLKNSYLELKGSKAKINPEKIIPQGPVGGLPVAVFFQFPKKTATGEPTIPANEKGLNFVTKIGKIELKVSFDLTKMTDKKGRDL